MKNKKLLYVLLPLTALVWGLIIYRIMQSLDVPKEEVLKSNIKRVSNGNSGILPDTFHLLLRYRDPFLTEQKRQVDKQESVIVAFALNNSSISRAIVSTVPPIVKPTVITPVWPRIEFNGLIENIEKKKRIAMLRIGETSHLMQEGQTAEKVKITKLLVDSVQVEYAKHRKYYRRS